MDDGSSETEGRKQSNVYPIQRGDDAMANEKTCEHPRERIDVEQLEPLDDGTPVLRAKCRDCGLEATEPLSVTYAPRPAEVGGRWLPLVKERGSVAVCACCGRPLFPKLHASPLVLFCRDEAGDVIGQVDVCWQCEAEDDLVDVLTRVFGRVEEETTER
jgi:hypothetical protein